MWEVPQRMGGLNWRRRHPEKILAASTNLAPATRAVQLASRQTMQWGPAVAGGRAAHVLHVGRNAEKLRPHCLAKKGGDMPLV